MQFSHSLQTKQRQELVDITKNVRESLAKSGVQDGLCLVFCPHTTAAITINENADPDVTRDFITGLKNALPNLAEFTHGEGNSDAHIKSSVVGASETVIVNQGKLVLGTWQGIYFCEFDGPRQRNFVVKLIG